MKQYHLGHDETYKASSKVWSFQFVKQKVYGTNQYALSLVKPFNFLFAGKVWSDSEQLYHCGRYYGDSDIGKKAQQLIATTSHRTIARYRAYKLGKAVENEGLRNVKLDWMLFCVWQKCQANNNFRNVLLNIPQEVTIVFDTTYEIDGETRRWGCTNLELANKRANAATVMMNKEQKVQRNIKRHFIDEEINKINDVGVWKGQNNFGKILMICRDCLQESISPNINYDLLNQQRINIMGRELRFIIPTKYQKVIDSYSDKAKSLSPLTALHHLTEMYMNECGNSLKFRTIIYEAGESWFARLMEENKEWREHLKGKECFMLAMSYFHEQFTGEGYGFYDICGLNEKDRRDTIEAYLNCIAKNLDNRIGVAEPFDENAMQAFCWGVSNKKYYYNDNDEWVKYEYIQTY